MADTEMKVVLNADTSSFDSKIKASTQTTQGLGDAAESVSTQSQVFADKWIANMRRLDEQTKSKIAGLQSVMKNLVDPNEIKKVEDQIARLNYNLGNVGTPEGINKAGAGGGGRNKSFMLQNISYQLQDIIVQTRDFDSFMRATGQQLPQMLVGFGAMGAVIGVFAGLLKPVVDYVKSIFNPLDIAKSKLDALVSPVVELREELSKPMETYMKLVKAPTSDPFIEVLSKAQATGTLPELTQAIKVQAILLEEEYKKAQQKVKDLAVKASDTAIYDITTGIKIGEGPEQDPELGKIATRNEEKLKKEVEYTRAKQVLLDEYSTMEQKIDAQSAVRSYELGKLQQGNVLKLIELQQKLENLSSDYNDQTAADIRAANRQIEQRQYELAAGERELDRQRAEARATSDRISELTRRLNRGEGGDDPSYKYTKGIKELTAALNASKRTPEQYKIFYEELAKMRKDYERTLYGDLVKDDYVQVFEDRLNKVNRALKDGKLTQAQAQKEIDDANKKLAYAQASEQERIQLDKDSAQLQNAKDFILKMSDLNKDARQLENEQIERQLESNQLTVEQANAKRLLNNKAFLDALKEQQAKFDPNERAALAQEKFDKREKEITDAYVKGIFTRKQADDARALNLEQKQTAERVSLTGLNNLYRNQQDAIKGGNTDLEKLIELRSKSNDPREVEYLTEAINKQRESNINLLTEQEKAALFVETFTLKNRNLAKTYGGLLEAQANFLGSKQSSEWQALEDNLSSYQDQLLKTKGVFGEMGADFKSKFADSISKDLADGKLNLKSFAEGFLKEWAQMLIKRQLLSLQTALFEKALGIFGGALSGGTPFGGSVLGNSAAAPSLNGNGTVGDVEFLGAAANQLSGNAVNDALGRVENASNRGGTGVTVNVNNMAGVEVSTQTNQRPDGGVDIDIMLEKKVTQMVAGGKLDGVMGTSFGISRRGVR